MMSDLTFSTDLLFGFDFISAHLHDKRASCTCKHSQPLHPLGTLKKGVL